MPCLNRKGPVMNRSSDSTDLATVTVPGDAPEAGERLPYPTEALGFTAEQIILWHRDQAILNADARTAGAMNRPGWLVERVLREANPTPVQGMEGIAKLRAGAFVVVLEAKVRDAYAGIGVVVRTSKEDALVDVCGKEVWVHWRRLQTLEATGPR